MRLVGMRVQKPTQTESMLMELQQLQPETASHDHGMGSVTVAERQDHARIGGFCTFQQLAIKLRQARLIH